MTDDEIRVLELQAMLQRLVAIEPKWLPAKEFALTLSAEEQRRYRADLAYNLKAKREHAPTLNADAQAYWDAFRDLCKRVNITRGRTERNRLVDKAAELMEQFDQLPAGERDKFRKINPAKGDEVWAKALHELAHDLPLLDESHGWQQHYDYVENHTQRQFLVDLIHRLSPSPDEVVSPEEQEQQRKQRQELMSLAKRLGR